MVIRRPAIVLSPNMKGQSGLATILPLSTTNPSPARRYHYPLKFNPVLPPPWSSSQMWVKGDMIYTMSLARMDRPHTKDRITGKRQYITRVVDPAELVEIQKCMLHGLGLAELTDHL